MPSPEDSRGSWGNNCMGMWLLASRGKGWAFRTPLPLWTQCLLPLWGSSKRTSLLCTDNYLDEVDKDGLGQGSQNVSLGSFPLNKLADLLQTRFLFPRPHESQYLCVGLANLHFKEVILLYTGSHWPMDILNGEKVMFLLFLLFWLPLCIVHQVQLMLFSFAPSSM